jgi:hypothetical protein
MKFDTVADDVRRCHANGEWYGLAGACGELLIAAEYDGEAKALAARVLTDDVWRHLRDNVDYLRHRHRSTLARYSQLIEYGGRYEYEEVMQIVTLRGTIECVGTVLQTIDPGSEVVTVDDARLAEVLADNKAHQHEVAGSARVRLLAPALWWHRPV